MDDRSGKLCAQSTQNSTYIKFSMQYVRVPVLIVLDVCTTVSLDPLPHFDHSTKFQKLNHQEHQRMGHLGGQSGCEQKVDVKSGPD
eukprot:884362-Amphidinium_carterae.1